jgi:hypothetical protein
VSTKPHKGTITDWWKCPCDRPNTLGYCIAGTFKDHPQFAGYDGYTSWVVKHDEATGEVETRNSRYTLEGSEVE